MSTIVDDDAAARQLDALTSRVEIEQRVHQYAYMFDLGDPSLVEQVFHSDATLSLGAHGDHTGLDALRKIVHELIAGFPHMRHFMSNLVVTMESPDAATGIVSVHALLDSAEDGPTTATGVYRDRFERRDGRWKIAERSFETHA